MCYNFGPFSNWCAVCCLSPWKACPFLNGDGWGADGEVGRWEKGVWMVREKVGETMVHMKNKWKNLIK